MTRPDRSVTHMGLTDDELVEGLLNAYRSGVFPMADAGSGEVRFYRTDPRGVLPLRESPAQRTSTSGDPCHGLASETSRAVSRGEGSRRARVVEDANPWHVDSVLTFHVPRTVEKLLRQGRFEFRTNTAFAEVIRGCTLPRPECEEDRAGTTLPGTWINDTIIAWYELLHERGHAHSVEAWITAYNDSGVRESRLVGGIYGVAIGAAFFGESMFHLPLPRRADGSRDPFDGTSAGQACLVVLVRRLIAAGFKLFDTQMVTGVTRRFGAHEVPLAAYMESLHSAVNMPDIDAF